MWNLFKSEIGQPSILESLLDTCPVTLDKLLCPPVSQFPFSVRMGMIFVLLCFTKCWKHYKQHCNKHFMHIYSLTSIY